LLHPRSRFAAGGLFAEAEVADLPKRNGVEVEPVAEVVDVATQAASVAAVAKA
jgi:hypothetical protein